MREFKDIVKKIINTSIAIIFWLLVWCFLSYRINSDIFLPSPEDTFKALRRLCVKKEFWKIIYNTFSRVAEGFIIAVICGTISAILAYFIKVIDILLSPIMRLIKTVPVVSFIILALLWINSEKLSILISFCMVLPVVYINILQACKSVKSDMLEMGKVFNMRWHMKLRFIYFPEIFPSFISSCKIGLGFCFKSGIAAEVIGLPAQSIGSELYKSKLYLMTDELFAWTFVIITMSVFLEGICIYIFNMLGKMAGRVNVSEKYYSESLDRHTGGGNEKKTDDMLSTEQLDKRISKKSSKKICISNLCKSYGKNVVLSNINLVLENEQVVCINGESGIGKTTLLKILAGIVKSDSGDIVYETGEEYKVSMVFQEDRLIEESDVYSNLYCVLDSDFLKSDVDRHLAMVDLQDVGNVKVRELSGGMKRRVAIVRAMLKKSDVILLDEPFKGLDYILKQKVIDYVKNNANGRIVLMVSHDTQECEAIGGRIIHMKNENW
jgi:NitT/TauT family transport system permease protein